MASKKTDTVTVTDVVSIAQEEDKLKAVRLVRQGGALRLFWTKSAEAGRVDIETFAAECDLPARTAVSTEENRGKVAVAGFDSAGAVFYRINVPAVKKEEIRAIVELQMETRLPLPAEQIEFAWRPGTAQDGQVAVTIAAAKREHLQEFVETVSGFEPATIVLDCEGIVKTWRAFFSGSYETAIVVSMGSRNTRVCLAESGRLVNAMSLDIGTEDFPGAGGVAAGTEAAERLAQDMRGVLELFGYADPVAVPVFVLSDGGRAIKNVVSFLSSAGFNVKAAVPDVHKFSAHGELGPEDVYEYRVPIGLACLALDGDVQELNVFERLYEPAGKEVKKPWFYSLKVTGAITAGVLALLVIVLYLVDVANERHLSRLGTEANFKQLMRRQMLIRTVARERPDLLALLNELSSSESEGILLDSLSFEKGEPVSVSGQAGGAEQVYKFQESLGDRKGITNVMIQSQGKDPKGDKFKFTITFHYSYFTKRKGRA
ncbi:MAG: hypothetical protein ACYS9T_10880 [Planctomycetota bacterium]|jgi:hypothetical protein